MKIDPKTLFTECEKNGENLYCGFLYDGQNVYGYCFDKDINNIIKWAIDDIRAGKNFEIKQIL